MQTIGNLIIVFIALRILWRYAKRLLSLVFFVIEFLVVMGALFAIVSVLEYIGII